MDYPPWKMFAGLALARSGHGNTTDPSITHIQACGGVSRQKHRTRAVIPLFEKIYAPQ
jgi:hypothetical protein